MSEYLYRGIDPDARRAIKAAISRYPRLCADLARQAEDILHATPQVDVHVSSAPGDPTACRAMQLSSRYRMEAERKCAAVKKCLDLLTPEHYHVVCLRFWGTSTAEDAIKKAKRGHPLVGMLNESIYPKITVPQKAYTCDRQVRRICKAFVRAVGEELGEI